MSLIYIDNTLKVNYKKHFQRLIKNRSIIARYFSLLFDIFLSLYVDYTLQSYSHIFAFENLDFSMFSFE